MSNKQGSVQLTRQQIEYLMDKAGTDDPQEAVEIFVTILREENMDPMKMPLYVNKIMEREARNK